MATMYIPALGDVPVLTIEQAREKGYDVVRGDYQNTPDNQRNRFYVERLDGPVCRFGPGYATQLAALEALTEQLLAFA